MPKYTADRIAELLNTQGLPVFGTEILGVGIAYKPGIGDDRESASIEVLRELEARGAKISVLDPVVGEERIAAHGFAPVAPGDPLERFAAAAILTDHPELDLEAIAAAVPAILDTRGAFRRAGLDPGNVVRL